MYQVTAIDPDGGGKNPDVPKDITSSVNATGDYVDVSKVGTYVVHYSVTDSDNNNVTKDRLVVVNDGRYGPSPVANGRVLFAKPFVIRSSFVAASYTDQVIQVRGLTGAKLFAGSDESTSVLAGTVLPNDQVNFTSLGGYSATPKVYDITVSGIDNPAVSSSPIVRQVTAEVVDAEVLESGPAGDNVNTYYIFGNPIQLTPVQADAIQTDPRGMEVALLDALGAGARLTKADGT